MIAFSEKLRQIDARFKRTPPERYARWLLIPSILVIVTLGPATYSWGVDGPFRAIHYPWATLIWMLSLPFAFLSYEGFVATWRSHLPLSQKFAFLICHLAAATLSLVPLAVLLSVSLAIGGTNGDR